MSCIYPLRAGVLPSTSSSSPRRRGRRHAGRIHVRPSSSSSMARRLVAGPAGSPCRPGPDWRTWPLFEGAPSTPMAAGRLALLGDAAHAVLPFLAQGGALAIEDGAMLAAWLGDGQGAPRASSRPICAETVRPRRAYSPRIASQWCALSLAFQPPPPGATWCSGCSAARRSSPATTGFIAGRRRWTGPARLDRPAVRPYPGALRRTMNGRLVELVDTRHLKCLELCSWGFESPSGHHYPTDRRAAPSRPGVTPSRGPRADPRPRARR